MKTLAVITTLIIVVATILAGTGRADFIFEFLRYVPGRDVTGHFVIFAALGLSVAAWLRRSGRAWASVHWPWIIVGLGVLATLDELSQRFIEARSFSFADLSASLGGLLVGALASSWPGLRRVGVSDDEPAE